jgi:hypothetical protein
VEGGNGRLLLLLLLRQALCTALRAKKGSRGRLLLLLLLPLSGF